MAKLAQEQLEAVAKRVAQEEALVSAQRKLVVKKERATSTNDSFDQLLARLEAELRTTRNDRRAVRRQRREKRLDKVHEVRAQ